MQFLARMYPETAAGGFPAQHSRANFFGRIRTLLPDDAKIMDFGAGRGKFVELDAAPLRTITDLTKVAQLTVFDVDETVLENAESTDRHYAPIGAALPFEDNSFDLIYCTSVAEHIADPAFYAAEIGRVLRPGGWFCALTPNKWGIIAIGARLVPESLHDAVLKILAPNRKTIDTFPTTYRLNTMADVARHFPNWTNASYFWKGPIAYHGNKVFLFHMWRLVEALLPRSMAKQLFIFVRKPAT